MFSDSRSIPSCTTVFSRSRTLWNATDSGGTLRLVADEWLTVDEALAYLKVGRTTLYRWMAEDRLPYRELSSGGGRRIRRSDLDRMLLDPKARAERENDPA